MVHSAIVLALVIPICAASVDFTYSTLYDIYDFVGKKEVRIPRCNNGCLIFASTRGEGFTNSASGYDPYSENMFIRDNKLETDYRVSDISSGFDGNAKKIPLTLTGPANISLVNKNTKDEDAQPIVIYIVEKAKAAEFSYSIYDALNVRGVTVNPNGVVTVMSADPFTLSASKDGAKNGVTAVRLTGFDNVKNGNIDVCSNAFSMPSTTPFPGFNLNINGPIVSFLLGERNSVQIDAYTGLEQNPSLGVNGFITSPGYNGCKKAHQGGIQSFRSPTYKTTDSFLLTSAKNYNVSFNVESNLNSQHSVTVSDVTNGQPKTITGNQATSFTFTKTNAVEVKFENLEGDQVFMLKHTDVLAQ